MTGRDGGRSRYAASDSPASGKKRWVSVKLGSIERIISGSGKLWALGNGKITALDGSGSIAYVMETEASWAAYAGGRLYDWVAMDSETSVAKMLASIRTDTAKDAADTKTIESQRLQSCSPPIPLWRTSAPHQKSGRVLGVESTWGAPAGNSMDSLRLLCQFFSIRFSC